MGVFTREQVLVKFLQDEFSYEAAQQGILYFMFDENIRRGEYEGNMYILKKLDSYTYVIYAELTFVKEGRTEIASCHAYTRAELLSAMAKATGKSEEELQAMGERWCNWE